MLREIITWLRSLFRRPVTEQLTLDIDRQTYVNYMTNWQRNQWARAGYPQDYGGLYYYANLQRERVQL